jgi:cell division protein FtsB
MRGVKTKTNSKWKRFGIFLILFLLCIVLLNSVYGVYQKKKNAEDLLSRMQTEVSTLKQKETYLTEALQKLEMVEGIKFEIRKKLNVAEAGESVAIIVEEPKATSSKSFSPSSFQQLKNFFQDLFD